MYVFLLLLFSGLGAAQRATIDYYNKIIEEGINKSVNYKPPNKNAEFSKGIYSNFTQDFGTFDFIIVGAGSAGSVLATRLSEITNFKILLLEAGKSEDDFSNIPNMVGYLSNSKKNWGYLSIPQNNSCNGQRCVIPRGKSIGGSSAINNLIYTRGNPRDFEKWPYSWSYKNVLPYFKKSENSQINTDDGYHGKGGFLNVEHALPHSKILSNFIEANRNFHLEEIDFNGVTQIGVGPVQYNHKHGKRQSTGTAFLDNARQRKNLKIMTRSLVTKILINQGEKAEGVEFATRDKKLKAHARKEVILSAGSINSPQLLMLSGIGPKEHLAELGIEVLKDLPVGENLIDHPYIYFTFNTNYTEESTPLDDQIEEYFDGLGPLTKGNYCDGLAFASLDNTTIPTIEYTFSVLPRNGTSLLAVPMIMLKEKSRGRVTLKSNDPIDFPLINENIFSVEEDLEVFVKGINFVLQIMKSEPFQRINTTLIDLGICGEFPEFSYKFWRCVAVSMGAPSSHTCGTTAIGSVVDPDLKVYGLQGLRVVDAGVFPDITSGHTNAPTIMVAEKISDVIKGEYGYGKTNP